MTLAHADTVVSPSDESPEWMRQDYAFLVVGTVFGGLGQGQDTDWPSWVDRACSSFPEALPRPVEGSIPDRRSFVPMILARGLSRLPSSVLWAPPNAKTALERKEPKLRPEGLSSHKPCGFFPSAPPPARVLSSQKEGDETRGSMCKTHRYRIV